MEKILGLNADIIFLFQTPSIPRAWQDGKIVPAVQRFFRDSSEVEAEYNSTDSEFTRGERLLNLYIKNISETRKAIDGARYEKRPTIIESVRVKKDNIFYYDLLFIFRKTSGNAPWLKGILSASDEIESVDAK